MTRVVPLAGYRACHQGRPVFFSRGEMAVLLRFYSLRVSEGEWRDYAIGSDEGQAWFAVCRYAGERPVYTVTKRAVSDQIIYALFDGDHRVWQGGCLPDVLGRFDFLSDVQA